MFIEDTGRIFVNVQDKESFHDVVKDFLMSCCEPVSRPRFINEYAITPASLSAAAAEGTYSTDDIRNILRRYRKTSSSCSSNNALEMAAVSPGADDMADAPLPAAIEAMLRDEDTAEKIQLSLQPNVGAAAVSSMDSGSGSHDPRSDARLVYVLQCCDKKYLERIAEAVHEFLEPYRIGSQTTLIISDLEREVASSFVNGRRESAFVSGEGSSTANDTNSNSVEPRKRLRDDSWRNEKPLEPAVQSSLAVRRLAARTPKPVMVYKCRVKEGLQRQLREALFSRRVRIQFTYDFVKDRSTPSIANFSLKHDVRLRPYQEESLERFHRGHKAHNGVVVLPCGAGKTLTGIAAAATVGKRVIVMCCNVLSVLQWRREFLKWTQLSPSQVTVCVRGEKQLPGDVFITTYTMLTASRPNLQRKEITEDARLTQTILQEIRNATWGVLLLDEVHIAPADRFQEVINCVKHHCVLGLSATLLREDERIENLRFLVGPKLFEANWLELTQRGFLAPVVCIDVRCPMPATFLRMYLDQRRTSTDESLRDLASVSPYKIWATQALLHFHANRSPPDKVIIFCDSIPALQIYAHLLGVPFMDGRTPERERATLLEYFRSSSCLNTIILSRVGDIALDIPEATVIIQLSGLGASRRQEAQRLGRILRPKPPALDSSTAYFYTLVSEDTDETADAFGRQEWLRDQGFAYRMLSCSEAMQHYRQQAPHSTATAAGSTAAPGRRLRCIGPPTWYWQCTGAEPEWLLSAYFPYLSKLHPSSGGPSRESSAARWIAFSPADSLRIDTCFIKGIPRVDLRHSHGHGGAAHKSGGGSAATMVGHHAILNHMGAVVHFDAADAPNSFGTVMFTPPEDRTSSVGSDVRLVERRVSHRVVDLHDAPLHDCAHDEGCLQWLMQRVMDHKAQVPSASKER